MKNNQVLCVVGPTACGKTKMGVLLAKRYGGEVVSVDSMQIYRGMTIGSAAPTAEEMEGVPHHMVAVADPRESWSVARFTQEADRRVQDILARGKLPVLVGGTGLYLDALIEGRTFAAGQSGGAVRRELEAWLAAEGPEALLAELRQTDPEAASRLSPGDGKRIVRDREDLRRRIGQRVDAMAEEGLAEEVRALRDLGVPRDATAFQAIGYKELLAWLDGETTLEEALEEVKLRSRQYAKRQLTWLRRNGDIHWICWEKRPDFAAGLQDATRFLSARGLQCP